MAKPVSFGHIAVGVTIGPAGDSPERQDAPFRILVLGDLSGRADRGATGLAGRRPVRVDRDNLETVIAKFGAAIRLPVAGPGSEPLTIGFAELEDFHPDRLYQRVEAFGQLRSLRRRLQDPATFEAAAAEVRGWQAPPPAAKPAPAEAESPAPSGGTGITLDDLLGSAPAAGRRADPTDASALIQAIVAPYMQSVPNIGRQQAELVAGVDDAATGLMRAILHAPAFQALEAAWRGVEFLVRRLESDGPLSIHLLDVSKAELAADLAAGDDLGRTGLGKLLIEQAVGTPGGEPWAVVLGCYTFGPTAADAELLGRLAKVARPAGCAVVAAADPRLVGCDALAKHPDPDDWNLPADPDGGPAWDALRKLPESAHVGLALPRLLLRRPYGRQSDPTEQFDFEELGAPPDHEHYLWGNPAFAGTYLLGEAFTRSGWGLRPGEVFEIGGLPTHVSKAGGESEMKPCAEVILTDRAARKIAEAGLMPLVSVRGRDAVRLTNFQPLARSAGALAGRWRP
jgi:type VI secretion system protein ImpC